MAPKKKASAKAGTQDEEPVAKATAAAPKAEAKAKAETKGKAKAEAKAAKRQADDQQAEPPKKAAKKEEAEEEGEKEQDAPADKRPAIQDAISYNATDLTLNVVPTAGGRVLMALTEGGMQYLIAGARADVGMKAGRYMFEVKIIEALNPSEAASGTGRGRAPAPRQLLRMGFSTAGSSTVLGDSEDHICFDSEGNYCVGKKKIPASQRFTRDQVIGVLLNLDPSSPNANTLSLFREGERIAEPQKLPEHLHGKVLFPHVSFRNVTVQVTFGPQPARALPFKCRMLSGAAKDDVIVSKVAEPSGGKYEVVLPVAFPDEGTFDWLDTFLAKHPDHVELSDRKILDWAAASGMWKPKASGWKNSNDKPEFNFGLPGMDDYSVQRVLKAVSPVIPRNYVVMEVKSNLIESERAEVLQRFSAPHFKKIAHVVMGEPNEEFKNMQLDKLLKEKQEKADVAWRAKKAEETRKKDMEKRQKQLSEMKKKADDERKKKADESKKKAEAAKKKAEAAKKKAESKKKAEEAGEEYVSEPEAEEEDPKADVEAKMEVDGDVKEETKDEDDDKKVDMDIDEESEPPKVELTEDEQKMWFRPQPQGTCGDIAPAMLNQAFAHFTIPEKSEGFDDVRFEWQSAEASKAYLRKWVLEKKRTCRVEDLVGGEWFTEKNKEWIKTFADWQGKQKAFKNSAAQKEKEAAAKKKLEAAAKASAAGEEVPDEEEEEDKAVVDIGSVADVNDVGGGEPLYKDFTFEDWALLQLRLELHLLQAAFKKDVNDPDRPGVTETHMAFYYNKYFRKQLTPKAFNVNGLPELVNLVKDCLSLDSGEDKMLTSMLDDEEGFERFVLLAEDQRRERQRRIDAGDETARLKFTAMAIQQPTSAKAPTLAGSAVTPGVSGVRPPLGTTAPTASKFGKGWSGKGTW